MGRWGSETKFLLKLTLNRYDGGFIDAQWEFEMQTRWYFLDVLTKTLHYGNRIAGHSKERGPDAHAKQKYQ